MSRREQGRKQELPRLQKVLAAAGLGSRRECEDLIVDGRVEIDRVVVTELGTRVDPASQAIRVDGVALKQPQRRYFAVHKPPGVLSTSKDQWGRARVIDLVDSKDRLFSIGRLDKDSSGLILVTNDGDLANKLTHPRYRVDKTYQVTVAGFPSQDVLRKVRRGVVLAEGPVKPESVVLKKRIKNTTLLEIVLAEGRNREIRRMLARVDHKVLRLHRIAIGPIRLGMLPRGAHRELTPAEVQKLRELGSPKNRTQKRKKVRPKKQAKGKSLAAAKKKRATKKSQKMGAVIGGGGTKRSFARPSKTGKKKRATAGKFAKHKKR